MRLTLVMLLCGCWSWGVTVQVRPASKWVKPTPLCRAPDGVTPLYGGKSFECWELTDGGAQWRELGAPP